MSVETENIILPKTLEEFTETDSLCDALKDPTFLAKVPLLNYTPLHKLKNHALVRFRGMIQDMVDPEIYLEKYEVKSDNGDTRLQCGKFRDTLVMKNGENVNFESNANVHGERRTLFVVSIPGLNEWAQTYESDCNKQNLESAANAKSSENATSKKRAFTDEGLLMETEDIPSTGINNNTVNGTNKRQCLESETIANTESKSSLIGVQYMLNSPIPERPSLACMVKIYNDLEDYILDTVIDAVGFLSVDPSLDGTAMDTDECQYISATELHAQNPPPSIIPRLHAIVVHRLRHCNPLLDERILALKPHPIVDAVNAFKDLHRMLTLCLFNDSLAADYLISHLISTVYNRSEGESIGKFSLNIYNFPQKDLSTYTDKLYKILELLLPASHYLPMTLDNINNSTFVPK
ncbi:mini-chromosome maintenance complex-binding protein-like [Teleopsis dalmanni]|uniref:mini-chromosome maintenance complex-binding protein-like n=1 Tax=Teleopsis dalmanni TaxID=139649 RepID=UPI0018CDB1F7|nr:mini-chromosome maintenance complex-binding protein-like [Teleopsis dalmanni]